MKISACEEKLRSVGFEPNEEIEAVPSDDIDKNRVVKTEPEAGRSVKKGTKVTIYKSSGESTIALENYIGKNAIEVKTFLETKYELVVTISKKDPEDTTKEYGDDEIIGQSLAVGSLVKKGDQLILYIPNVVDTFPDMAEEGWSVADVEAFCNKYGLTLQKQEEETTAYAAGTVIRQSRTKGTPIIKGTTLTITVAIKPKEKPTSSEDEKPKEENSENNSGDNSEKPDGE